MVEETHKLDDNDNLMEFDICDSSRLLAGDCIVERLEEGEVLLSPTQEMVGSLTPSKTAS